MPLLEYYDRVTPGSYTNTYYTGQAPTVTSEPVARNRLYKFGTGPRIKPQQLDETAYQMSLRSYNWPRGRGEYRRSGALLQEYKGQTPGFAGLQSVDQQGWRWPTLAHDSNIKDIANLKALSSLNQRDLDLGTAWLERGKTADLITSTAKTTVEALNAIRRRNGRELLEVLGLNHRNARGSGFVNAALAYWYGVKPLMYDVAGAVQSLARMEPDSWRITAKEAHAENHTKVLNLLSGGVWRVNGRLNSRASCRATISAIQRPLTRRQDMMWSLGLDNPLSTIYEVTPYSFVLDWVLPIGDWLSALNSIKYYSGWTCTYSEFLKEEATWVGATNVVSGTDATSNYCSGHGMHMHVNRTITSIPLVGLPIKDPRSMLHMAQALSLLASTLSRGGSLPSSIRY